MSTLITSYFIYNLAAGFFLAIYCYYSDKNQLHGYDLLWVLLFPALGWGYWRYNKELRDSGSTELPREWYMCKQMIKINWGYIIVMGLWAFSLVEGCNKMVGGGLEWAHQQNDRLSTGIGLMYDIGSGTAFMIFWLMLVLGLGILFAIFVLIPSIYVKSIESRHYKMQLLKEREASKLDT